DALGDVAATAAAFVAQHLADQQPALGGHARYADLVARYGRDGAGYVGAVPVAILGAAAAAAEVLGIGNLAPKVFVVQVAARIQHRHRFALPLGLPPQVGNPIQAQPPVDRLAQRLRL